MRERSQNGITWPQCYRFRLSISPLVHMINPFCVVLSLSRHSNHFACFSPFGDVMETKYCTVKLFILPSPLYPAPISTSL